MSLRIKEEVGPVWISLHVSELKELSQAQDQDLFTNLAKQKRRKEREEKVSDCGKTALPSLLRTDRRL